MSWYSGMMNRAANGLAFLALRAQKLGSMPLRDPSVSTLFGYMDTTSGVSVTEWTALNCSAVWAAIRLISESCASLPLQAFRRGTLGTRDKADDHDTYALLHDEPNGEMTPLVFRETVTAHCLGWGNGYMEIERSGAGRPIALWPLTPNRVVPDRTKSGKLYYIVRKPSGGADTIPLENMLHIPGLGFDGVMGYSVVTMARETIGLALASERFGASFYGNGTVPRGVLTTDKEMKKEAIDNLRETFSLKHQGVDRANKVAILTHGLKYQPTQIMPEEAQFLGTRKYSVQEIARWFNIPPHMLRDLERATHSNIEQQSIEYVIYTLRPWLIRWEQELKRKLLSPAERKTLYYEHNVAGLLRGDMKARYDSYAVGRQWGWLSANDVLEMENSNPLPGVQGNSYWMPVNMTDAAAPNPNTGHVPGSAGGDHNPKLLDPSGTVKPVTRNPTDPVQPLVGRSVRGVKPTLDTHAVELLIRAQPTHDKDGKPHMNVPFASVKKPPFEQTASDMKDLPVKKVKLAGMVALRPDLSIDRVCDFVKDPDATPSDTSTHADIDGLPTDRPYVVCSGGLNYIYDGTHRCAAAMLSGATKVKAYHKEL